MAERIEKREVVMKSPVGYDVNGALLEHVVTDYVPVEILDAYVADARTRWASVTVGTEHNPGPAGDDGDTHYPEHLI